MKTWIAGMVVSLMASAIAQAQPVAAPDKELPDWHVISTGSLTDTWWIPSEPGRGFTVAHEGNTIALGVFEHDAQGQPRWYNAVLQRYGSDANGDPQFSGMLTETTKTAENRVTRVLGEVHFRARANGKAEIEYTTDAGHQLHTIERFTVVAQDSLEGLHLATLLPEYDSCPNDFVGLSVMEYGTLYIDRCEGAECEQDPPLPNRNRAVVHMNFMSGAEETCSIEGRFQRYGNSGGITGTYECADGGHGEIAMKNIEFTSTGFTTRFIAEHPKCGSFYGILSGVRSNAR